MIADCANLAAQGVIEGVLGGVDCETRSLAAAGYGALTSGSSVFQQALTAILTIYVAVTGYRMLVASRGVRLSSVSGMALKIGAVLALVTSWPTFQTLVFNVAADAPGELAAAIAEPFRGAEGIGGDPVRGLQDVYDQLTSVEVAFGKSAGNATTYSSPAAAAADSLSTASGVLFLSTAGVLAATTIVIGVLTAAGPIFISLFVMPVTRGLFVGWLRALAAAALVTMVTWLLIVAELHLLQPWLDQLREQQRAGTLDPQTARSVTALVYVFGGGEVALAIGALVVALGFRLPAPATGNKASEDASPLTVNSATATLPSG
ncbi:MAG TPA: type IV secretion system protein, partial [Phenylobacterium sp.]|uniref:type IV secretion system protein n=1 Tax=Phenylobacterium sp. TaxID=1871053 RepID=UPI002B46919E